MEENIKEYEICYLLTKPEAEQEIVNVLKKIKADVFYQRPVADMRLAYSIKKHTSAYFGFSQFRAAPDEIKSINDTLGLNKNVLRFLIITPPPKAQKQNGTAPEKPERKAAPTVLSNEALSEKLEEILK